MIIEHKELVGWDEMPDSFIEKWQSEIELVASLDYCGEAFTVEMEADYLPYCPGRYHGPPDKCYPSEEADVEVLSYVITPATNERIGGYAPTALYDAIIEYATEWLDCETEEIRTRLLEKGKSIHADEISEILASIEADADSKRDRDIEDRLIDGEAADWLARRTSTRE